MTGLIPIRTKKKFVDNKRGKVEKKVFPENAWGHVKVNVNPKLAKKGDREGNVFNQLWEGGSRRENMGEGNNRKVASR